MVDYRNRCEVDVAGVRTAYYDLGSGFPVLLVHGGDPRSAANSCDWGRYAELLARRYRVILVDKLAQGFTANPKRLEDYTMSAACRHVQAFVDVLDLPEFVAVGHSRGALPAAHLAWNLPERVRALVVFDSNTLGPDDPSVPPDFYDRIYRGEADPDDPAYLLREPILNAYNFAHIDDEQLAARQAVTALPERAQARAVMAEHYDRLYEPDVVATRQQTLDAIADGRLRADTLIAWGRQDPSAPLPVGERLFELLSTAPGGRRTEWELFDESGHYPFREHPEASAERTVQFFKPLDLPEPPTDH